MQLGQMLALPLVASWLNQVLGQFGALWHDALIGFASNLTGESWINLCDSVTVLYLRACVCIWLVLMTCCLSAIVVMATVALLSRTGWLIQLQQIAQDQCAFRSDGSSLFLTLSRWKGKRLNQIGFESAFVGKATNWSQTRRKEKHTMFYMRFV